MNGKGPPSNAAIVILAAGRSSRMGDRNKLLLEWAGSKSVVRQVAENAAASGVRNIFAVTGHEAEAVSAALEGSGVRVIHNPDYGKGQAGSLRAGVRAASDSGASGVLVLLGDMPLVGPDTIRTVLSVARKDSERIVQPVSKGKPAHPVWLPMRLAGAIDRQTGDQGARQLIASDSLPVTKIEVGQSATVDLDTEEDYRAALKNA